MNRGFGSGERVGATGPGRPTARDAAVLRIGFGILAAVQVAIGVWALLVPASFFEDFPMAGRSWVALLPPYNEHLVRDVGALSLAISVVLTAAAITARRAESLIALAAFAVYAVPHTVFHASHLQGFPAEDAVAQMAGFAIQLVLALILLVVTLRAAAGRSLRSRSAKAES